MRLLKGRTLHSGTKTYRSKIRPNFHQGSSAIPTQTPGRASRRSQMIRALAFRHASKMGWTSATERVKYRRPVAAIMPPPGPSLMGVVGTTIFSKLSLAHKRCMNWIPSFSILIEASNSNPITSR